MEGSIRTVRDSLERWREAVLIADSVLGWEQEWHPAATAGTLTAAFLAVWYMDPSLVTLVSLVGLFLTLTDYFGPKIIDLILKPDSWTVEKEKKLEGVCRSIVSVGGLISSLSNTCSSLRTNSPMLHFSLVTCSLLLLAWLGTLLSGTVLLYLSTLLVTMLPGLHRRGLLEKHCSAVLNKMKELVKGQGKKIE